MYASAHYATNTLAAAAVITSDPTTRGAGIALGLLLGSRLPDLAERRVYPRDAEGNLIPDENGYLLSSDGWCPHRTDTHWAVTWIIGLALSWAIPGALGWLAVGICAGSLLHIALDVLTPGGIPTILPSSGPRLAIPLFKGAGGQEGAALVLWIATIYTLGSAFRADKASTIAGLWELASFPFKVSDQILALIRGITG